MKALLQAIRRNYHRFFEYICRRFPIHPNILTSFRIALVIPVCFFQLLFFYFPETRTVLTSLAMLASYAAAWILDGMDGIMARLFKLVSQLGAFLDPLADKILFLGPLAIFYFYYQQVWPWNFWFLATMEIGLLLVRIGKIVVHTANNSTSQINLSAVYVGKVKTNFELSGNAALLLNIALPWIFWVYLANILFSVAILLAAASLYNQFRQ